MNTPLLQVEHLSRSFRRRSVFSKRSPVRAVDDVSFTLERGETLGLVGESGSGKSTLGRLVLRLIEPDNGKVMLEGDDVTALSAGRLRALRRDMQVVFQDPYGALDPRMSVGAIIEEPMRVHGVGSAERQPRLMDTMRRVGLDPSQVQRFPHQFSGGQRQRVGIARAIALSPKLLVLDEPVSALDVSIQAQIINLLQSLQRDGNLSFLFIAHNLAVVRHVSHRVAVMYLGRIVEIGAREAIYERPMHPYTVTLLSAVPLPDPAAERSRTRITPRGEIGSAANLPSGCRFHPRCYRARQMAEQHEVQTVQHGDELLPRACVEQDPKPVDHGLGHACACHYPELPQTRSPEAMRVLAPAGSATMPPLCAPSLPA